MFLPSSIIGFFYRALQPHLDQMQHTPIDDAPRERAHQLGVWNASEVVREVSVPDFRVAAQKVEAAFAASRRLAATK